MVTSSLSKWSILRATSLSSAGLAILMTPGTTSHLFLLTRTSFWDYPVTRGTWATSRMARWGQIWTGLVESCITEEQLSHLRQIFASHSFKFAWKRIWFSTLTTSPFYRMCLETTSEGIHSPGIELHTALALNLKQNRQVETNFEEILGHNLVNLYLYWTSLIQLAITPMRRL